MKTKLIIAVALIIPLILFLGFLAYHASGQYKIRDGKLFAGNREVSAINMQQYKWLSDDIVKDSSHVFLKGKIVEGIDASTFERLPDTKFFYRDKNALYFQRYGVFAIHNLVKPDGGFDVKTMRSCGPYSLVLRDKNGLYVINNNPVALFNLRKPLKKIDLKGIDTASFQQIMHEKGWTNEHFYRDNNRVFFATYGKLRPCPDIDRNSFQIIDFYLSKDKNKVYYLTQYLASDKKRRTKNADYAVLEGADGKTFCKVSDANEKYDDINGQWRIYHDSQHHHSPAARVIRKVKE